MKKALAVLAIYTAVLALMATAPVRLPERCPKPIITVTVPPKPVVKPEPKLEACYAILIPFVMVVHFHCAGEGFGGGGGSAW